VPLLQISPVGQGDNNATFLAHFRALRDRAALEYEELAARAHYPSEILKAAENGPDLPGLPVLVAYVRACGADEAEWEERWRRLADADGMGTEDLLSDAERDDGGLPVRPPGASPAAQAGARAGVTVVPADVHDPERIKAALRAHRPREDKPISGRGSSPASGSGSFSGSGWAFRSSSGNGSGSGTGTGLGTNTPNGSTTTNGTTTNGSTITKLANGQRHHWQSDAHSPAASAPASAPASGYVPSGSPAPPEPSAPPEPLAPPEPSALPESSAAPGYPVTPWPAAPASSAPASSAPAEFPTYADSAQADHSATVSSVQATDYFHAADVSLIAGHYPVANHPPAANHSAPAESTRNEPTASPTTGQSASTDRPPFAGTYPSATPDRRDRPGGGHLKLVAVAVVVLIVGIILFAIA
jgi:hypothetical protein